jgi:hypothetical protein
MWQAQRVQPHGSSTEAAAAHLAMVSSAHVVREAAADVFCPAAARLRWLRLLPFCGLAVAGCCGGAGQQQGLHTQLHVALVLQRRKPGAAAARHAQPDTLLFAATARRVCATSCHRRARLMKPRCAASSSCCALRGTSNAGGHGDSWV